MNGEVERGDAPRVDRTRELKRRWPWTLPRQELGAAHATPEEDGDGLANAVLKDVHDAAAGTRTGGARAVAPQDSTDTNVTGEARTSDSLPVTFFTFFVSPMMGMLAAKARYD